MADEILTSQCLQSSLPIVKPHETVVWVRFLTFWNIFRISLLETVSLLPFFFFFSALKPFLIRPLEQIFHRIIWLFVAKEHNGEVGIYPLSTCNLYIFVLRCFFPSQFFHVYQLAMVIVQEHFFRRGISESGYFCTWHLQTCPSLLGALDNACLKSFFKFSVSLRMMGQVILIHLPL